MEVDYVTSMKFSRGKVCKERLWTEILKFINTLLNTDQNVEIGQETIVKFSTVVSSKIQKALTAVF